MTYTKFPSLNYVSAKNLLPTCPPSIHIDINHYNPDRQVWINSYDREKQGLIDHDVYEKISESQYL